MDVQKIGKSQLKNVKSKKDVPAEKVTFTEIMNQGRNQATLDRLTNLMKELDQQGKILSENRSVETLNKFKKMVKDFMDEAIQHGLRLEEQRGFNRRGKMKVYKIVKQVDQKLVELTNTVLDEQSKSLMILDKVGEVKGLLVNIYT